MHTVPLFSFVRAPPPTATANSAPTVAAATDATATADADAADAAEAEAEAESPAYRVPHWILICFTDPTPAPPLLPCRVAAAPLHDDDCDDDAIWLRPLNVPPLHMAGLPTAIAAAGGARWDAAKFAEDAELYDARVHVRPRPPPHVQAAAAARARGDLQRSPRASNASTFNTPDCSPLLGAIVEGGGREGGNSQGNSQGLLPMLLPSSMLSKQLTNARSGGGGGGGGGVARVGVQRISSLTTPRSTVTEVSDEDSSSNDDNPVARRIVVPTARPGCSGGGASASLPPRFRPASASASAPALPSLPPPPQPGGGGAGNEGRGDGGANGAVRGGGAGGGGNGCGGGGGGSDRGRGSGGGGVKLGEGGERGRGAAVAAMPVPVPAGCTLSPFLGGAPSATSSIDGSPISMGIAPTSHGLSADLARPSSNTSSAYGSQGQAMMRGMHETSSLLTNHCSLLTNHCSLLTTHYPLLTTHYSLLTMADARWHSRGNVARWFRYPRAPRCPNPRTGQD